MLKPRSSPVRRVAGALAACALMLFVSPPLSGRAGAAPAPPFAATSPFNVAIKDWPALDPASSAMVARMTAHERLYANLYAYGIPIYTADQTTPRRKVTCTMEGAWGSCPLGQQPRRIPESATANTGEDGVLTVVDTTTNTVDEYWQARRVGASWQTSWGAVNSLGGSGWGGSSTGAGASRLAGVVRVAEIQAGVIRHAMVLQSDNVCARVVRPPALKTDGGSTRADCIPEGARIQLDPSISVDELPGLTAGERTVARAMQVYGAYMIDRAGTTLGMSFERAEDATGGYPGWIYVQAGLTHDYYGMPHVPWSKLRVLSSWQG